MNISHIDLKKFQQFICGIFQAEGTSGVYFVKKYSLRVAFNFSIGHNYSKEAAILFLRLQVFLGRIGKIKLLHTTAGQIHIRYSISNTQEIIEKAVPYFKFVYGDKRYVLSNLSKINNIWINIKNMTGIEQEDYLNQVSQFIHLVYSTNLHGNSRKIHLCTKSYSSLSSSPPP